MTERGAAELHRSSTDIAIGPSALTWDGATLTARIREIAVPLPCRLAGTIRFHPQAMPGQEFALDAAGRHRWQPLAPLARVEVSFARPALAWSGSGYWDANWGDEPLESGFLRWDWSRAGLAGGRAAVLYDATRSDGSARTLALRFDRAGAIAAFEPPPPSPLEPTFWRLARAIRAEAPARVEAALEDAPFYARSLLGVRILGEDTRAIHESLSLTRFRSRLVQAMLPVRMPRRTGRSCRA
ncbi:MAG: carotenoid 1,2-hydratase [Acetobacteraceae bacterium]